MAKKNDAQIIYTSNMGRMSSLHCQICYKDAVINGNVETKETEAYFGAEKNGGSTLGVTDLDHEWKLRIWRAFRKHFREEHQELITMVNRKIKRYGLKI